MPEPEIRELGIDQLKRGRWQNRERFDAEALQELAATIKEHGVVQPIVARFDPADGHYEIVAGERRWRAAQLAGHHRIRVLVHYELSNEKAHAMCLIENLQRKDLDPIEEARGYQMLVTEFGWQHQEIAGQVKRSRPYITNALRLLELEPEIQDMLRDNRLETGHVRPLLTLPSSWRLQLAQEIQKKGLNARQAETRARNLAALKAGKSATKEAPDPNVQRLEERLSEVLGHAVRITHDARTGAGEITIKYHSLEACEGLIEQMDPTNHRRYG